MKILALLLAGALFGGGAAFPLPAGDVPAGPYDLLGSLPEEYGRADGSEFRLEKELDTGFGKVYRFKQTAEGCDLFGYGLNLSVDRDGELLSVSGERFFGETETGTLSENEALAIVGEGAVSAGRTAYAENDAHAEVSYKIYRNDMQYFVSSVDGDILLSAPISAGAVSVQKDADGNDAEVVVEENGGIYYLSDYTRNIMICNAHGTEYGYDPYTSMTGSFGDGMAVSIYRNVIEAYDFYTKEENIGVSRYGIDGGHDTIPGNAQEKNEIPLVVLVHFGRNYENANCGYDEGSHTAFMYVGDGSPYGVLYRQGRALDVIAHEYQHAVTDRTAGFIYLNAAGALSEAFSDMFGALVEGRDPSGYDFWAIGEDGVTGRYAYLRSMKAPSEGQRATVAEMEPFCYQHHDHDAAGCDYGGTHANSTIPTHMQYKLYERMPAYFTRERIGKLWFATLCSLSENASFADFALAFRAAAKALDFTEEAQTAIEEELLASGLLPGETHTVTFVDGQGNELKREEVSYGGSATPPEAPDYTEGKFSYRFTGWEGSYDNVVSDVTVRATYESELRKCRVTFLDADGNVLGEETVEYGSGATAPASPEKEGGERVDYEFTGWSERFDEVMDDMTVSPLYREIPCFFVTFVSDGETVAVRRVRRGEGAAAPADPVRESSAQYEYVFRGWDRPFDVVVSDMTVSANFDGTLRSYGVTYFSEGEELRRETLSYGSEAAYRPVRAGYNFVGWYLDESLSTPAGAIEGETSLYAKWETVRGGCGVLSAGYFRGAGVALLAASVLALRPRKRRIG